MKWVLANDHLGHFTKASQGGAAVTHTILGHCSPRLSTSDVVCSLTWTAVEFLGHRRVSSDSSGSCSRGSARLKTHCIGLCTRDRGMIVVSKGVGGRPTPCRRPCLPAVVSIKCISIKVWYPILSLYSKVSLFSVSSVLGEIDDVMGGGGGGIKGHEQHRKP